MIGSITLKDIPKGIKASAVLMCLGIVMLLNACGWYMGAYTGDLRQNYIMMGMAVGCTALVVVLHEGLHGLFFRLFGGDVSFGVKWKTIFGPVFWASSSKLFPRVQSQTVALAPQLLTIVMLVVAVQLSATAQWLCLLMAGMNICGGAFDMYVAMRLRKFARACLVADTRDGVQVFAPE